jgi:FAD/FMN-containing dehydrogenase
MHISTSSLFAYFVVAVAAAYDESRTSICEDIASVLPNSTFSPETTTYNASITSYPFVQSRLHPTCIVRPKAAGDVVTVVRLLRKKKGSKFAVKGGGHNANVGFNNVEDGVTIDMQSLNAVEHNGNVARVDAGALWQNVYDVVEKRGHAVLGGRIGVVGVAGFLTGGSCPSIHLTLVYLAKEHSIEHC